MATSLSKGLRCELIDLNDLVRKERLFIRYDQTRMTYIINESKLRRRLLALHRMGKIVIPTHMVGKFLPKTDVKLVLVLRLDPVNLYKRLRAREWTKRKAWENTEAEIVGVCLSDSLSLFGHRKVYEIDTTRRSALSVYKEAVRALAEHRARSGRVDWLARYDPIKLEETL